MGHSTGSGSVLCPVGDPYVDKFPFEFVAEGFHSSPRVFEKDKGRFSDWGGSKIARVFDYAADAKTVLYINELEK